MIKVYQIQLTDAERTIVNTDGEYTPRIRLTSIVRLSRPSKLKTSSITLTLLTSTPLTWKKLFVP